MSGADTSIDGVSFDLFGTLVRVDGPDDPAAAVADALEARDVDVPDDWSTAYAEPHVEVPDGTELPLADHVVAALASRSDSLRGDDVRSDVEDAVFDAFEPRVETREDAASAVKTLADRLPVGVLSNCSVSGLAERALAESDVDESALDAVVTSVDCGWRKPAPRAFEAVAAELGVEVDRLVHVGDDPRTDGRATAAGARSVLVEETPLGAVPETLEERWG
ncbi:HAD family hydrolase [Halomicrococcus gelatinilyticus]|uniref:HAD family hydrolase n=1 Tax=Halomicrococcus gelatinilyticus TaxID=1702103 RepID=UPI002E100307